MILKVKIAQYLTLNLDDNASPDQQWEAVDVAVKANRAHLDFVIDEASLDGDTERANHLVDEPVG